MIMNEDNRKVIVHITTYLENMFKVLCFGKFSVNTDYVCEICVNKCMTYSAHFVCLCIYFLIF